MPDTHGVARAFTHYGRCIEVEDEQVLWDSFRATNYDFSIKVVGGRSTRISKISTKPNCHLGIADECKFRGNGIGNHNFPNYRSRFQSALSNVGVGEFILSWFF